jgi:hypothetical protein
MPFTRCVSSISCWDTVTVAKSGRFCAWTPLPILALTEIGNYLASQLFTRYVRFLDVDNCQQCPLTQVSVCSPDRANTTRNSGTVGSELRNSFAQCLLLTLG